MMPEFRILYLQVSVTPIQSSATVGPADSDLLGDSYAADDDDDEDDDKVIEKIGSLKQQLTAVESRIAQQVCTLLSLSLLLSSSINHQRNECVFVCSLFCITSED